MIRKIAFAALLLAATASTANATSGSIPFTGFGATQDGSNLLTSTEVTTTFSAVTSTGSGDYSGFTSGTLGSGSTLTFSDLSAFTFTVAGTTFAANSFSDLDEIVSRTANSVDVYLRGDFGGNDSSVRLNITFNGSLQEGYVLQTPAAPVPPIIPEPSSIVMGMLGACLVGTSIFARRRANNKV